MTRFRQLGFIAACAGVVALASMLVPAEADVELCQWVDVRHIEQPIITVKVYPGERCIRIIK